MKVLPLCFVFTLQCRQTIHNFAVQILMLTL